MNKLIAPLSLSANFPHLWKAINFESYGHPLV